MKQSDRQKIEQLVKDHKFMKPKQNILKLL